MLTRLIYLPLFLLLFISISCIKDTPTNPTPTPPISSSKSITSFVFKKADNPFLAADVPGVFDQDTVRVTFPISTLLSSLIPSITFSGKSINPIDRTPQNFTNPVTYTITAEDGTTKSYKVVAAYESNGATLYIGSTHSNPDFRGNVYAIDAGTGSLKWSYIPSFNTLLSSIAFSNSILYVGIGNNISAIDTITRRLKWEYNTGGAVFSTPIVSNGIVYAKSNDNFLYAVDAISGNLKWKYKQGDLINGGSYSSPTVVEGVVYTGGLDGYIYAIDAISGVLKWRTYNSDVPGVIIYSSPSVVNGVLYIGNNSHTITALNTNDGSFKWVYQITEGHAAVVSAPTVVNGILYASSLNGQLYAIDANTGTLKWKYFTGSNLSSSPIVSDGVVFVGQENVGRSLFAVDAITGILKWKYQHDAAIVSSPVVFNSTVYIGSYGSVIAVDATSGSLKWKFLTKGTNEDILASPCIVDKQGNIYVSGVSGDKN